MADPIFSEAGRLGALVLHLGTTLDERRARTAPARAALAAARERRRGATNPTLADRIAAVEAALPAMEPDERARQTEWVATARRSLSRLTELRQDSVRRKPATELAS